jgi:hypothetical protein
MAGPSRSDPVEHLSNFVRTTPSFVSHREELSWLKSILQEMRSATLRHALQEEAIKVCRLVGNIEALAKILVETIETTLTLAAGRASTTVDLQPLYVSDTTLLPVLACARS